MELIMQIVPWITAIGTLAAALRRFVVIPWIHDSMRRDKLAVERMDLLFEEMDALRNEMKLLRLVMEGRIRKIKEECQMINGRK